MNDFIRFDRDLIDRYDCTGPRYTSYPSAAQFDGNFSSQDYARIALATNQTLRPLSLYFHIPFCSTVCFYCACNKIVTKNRSRAIPYLEHLYREIVLQSHLYDPDRPVLQLHWGGGTPTFISDTQMNELMDMTHRHFHMLADDSGEYSIEIDPREADRHTIRLLRRLGFNRLSVGIQDFDPHVQQAVNRLQTYKQTHEVLDAARHEGFKSVSVDLIYGLPHQSVDSFSRTLEKVINLSPDRLSVFNYAHLPKRFKTQRQIRESDIPSAGTKLDILGRVISMLTSAGYIYVGMDHFAKPTDELVRAQRTRTLHRNFQGYSTHAECDLVGMGLTGISMVGNCYSQNSSDIDEYYALTGADQIPVCRGIELDWDDRLRRDILLELMCHCSLDIAELERDWGIEFLSYFNSERSRLEALQDDGLLTIDEKRIDVLPAGRLLIRNICMIFDRYLHATPSIERFSRTI